MERRGKEDEEEGKRKTRGDMTLYIYGWMDGWMDVCEMRGTRLLPTYLLTWIALDWMDGKGTVCLSVGSR